MVSERKIIGDIAVAKVITDLTMKGFVILTPVLCEHLPFDLIAYKDNISLRIQCKSSSDGFISNKNVWNDKNGSHTKVYAKEDFDYYAIYLSSIDKICYPNISFGGKRISPHIPNCATPFYYYEDFLEFTDVAVKRKNTNIDYVARINDNVRTSWKEAERIPWPNDEELEKLLWSKPMNQLSKDLGISDVAIAKRANNRKLSKPPKGYWIKQK